MLSNSSRPWWMDSVLLLSLSCMFLFIYLLVFNCKHYIDTLGLWVLTDLHVIFSGNLLWFFGFLHYPLRWVMGVLSIESVDSLKRHWKMRICVILFCSGAVTFRMSWTQRAILLRLGEFSSEPFIPAHGKQFLVLSIILTHVLFVYELITWWYTFLFIRNPNDIYWYTRASDKQQHFV